MPQPLKLLTYNTHEFGFDSNLEMQSFLGLLTSLGLSLPSFQDSDRKKALKAYARANPVDILALQEVWFRSYDEDIERDLKSSGPYPNYYSGTNSKITNSAGVILFSRAGLEFEQTYSFGYITQLQGPWHSQDTYPDTDKGYRGFRTSVQVDGTQVTLGVFTTHMPTSPHHFGPSIERCYEALATVISQFRQTYPDSVVFLIGDFNLSQVPESKDQDVYDKWIKNTSDPSRPAILEAVGLIDAYQTYADNIGDNYTVDPVHNLCWQAINKQSPTTCNGGCQRIDYMLYAGGSGSSSVRVTLTDLHVLNGTSQNARPTFEYNGRLDFDLSDHYPLQGTFEISVA